jgi:hypothetical protein
MKSYQKYIAGLTFVSCIMATSCKKDFFNQPPQDQITLDNFYQTTDQVNSSTNGLYNNVWFSWNNKASWAITELSGGNARTYSSDVINFANFSVTGDNTELGNAWSSLYTVVAQSNALINNLPTRVPASVPDAVKNNALGEAHFMRAMAYFYLVRLFGNVPIIENTLDYVNNYQINSNPVPDVYKFIVNDLKFAEANCNTAANKVTGHVSSGSASAVLAKVYLYMEDFENARIEADKVINSGEFKLVGIDAPGTYTSLFEASSNNNPETIAALQWAGASAYGHGNSQQASFAYTSQITGTGDGYSVIGPTIDLQRSYDPGDLRVHGTIMLAGDVYPELNRAGGGYKVPNDVNAQNTGAAIKKYVTGTPADVSPLVTAAQSAPNNTYLMRYAEVLLIKAEAMMAGAQTSSDPAVLAPINLVRRRAGLNAITSINRNHMVPNPAYDAVNNPSAPQMILRDDILHERRKELAIEGDYWFDLGRIDGFNKTSHPKAVAILKSQERGTYASATERTTIYHEDATTTFTEDKFIFPYPTTEVAADPKLKDAPVPYVFK